MRCGGSNSKLPPAPIPAGLLPVKITISPFSTSSNPVNYSNFVEWDDSATDIAHSLKFARSATINNTDECDSNNKEIIVITTLGSYTDSNLSANTTYCYYIIQTASNVVGAPHISEQAGTTKSQVASNLTINNGSARALIQWQTQVNNASFFDMSYTITYPDKSTLSNSINNINAKSNNDKYLYYIKGLLPNNIYNIDVTVISRNKDNVATSPAKVAGQIRPEIPVLSAIQSSVSPEFFTCLEKNSNGLSLDKIKNLTCTGMSPPIKSLDGIDYLLGLVSLNVFKNNIKTTKDMTLDHLTSLRNVNISSNQLVELDAISGTAITQLDISNNPLDVTALETLKTISTTLTTLHMNGAQPDDISILGFLTALTDLSLNNKNLTDLSFLTQLNNPSNIIALRLNNNIINNIDNTTLSTMTVLALLDLNLLTLLNLANNQISDISSLDGITTLKTLDLANNDIKSITLAAIIPNLAYLDLSKNPIQPVAEYTVLYNLQNTAILYLNDNMPSDPTFFTGLKPDVKNKLVLPQLYHSLFL